MGFKKFKNKKTTGYALVAAGYIAQHCQEGKVLASHISKQFNISLLYMFKVLEILVKANILRSRKGLNGGFSLARPANDITLLEIIEAVEGPMLNHLHLAKFSQNEPFSLKMEEVCQSATEKEKKLYSKAKLSEMIK